MSAHQLLLPSQESLLQRIAHVVSFSEQVAVVSGDAGSGKSTLVTALASEMDEYNCALVVCPLHADSAEIRRKILIQLINSPIFDDEVSLLDTVSRLQQKLQKPLHIIIDDAHLMPLDIWAECILLSQVHCANRPVAITVTVSEGYWSQLIVQLPENFRQWMMQMSIDALPLAEREGLYQSLLLRSGANPFISRDIIRDRLAKQTGTPQEVLDQLQLALSPQEEPKKTWLNWLNKWSVGLSVSVAVMVSVIAGWFYVSKSVKQVDVVETRALTVEESQKRDAAIKYLHQVGLGHVTASKQIVSRNEVDSNKLEINKEKQSINQSHMFVEQRVVPLVSTENNVTLPHIEEKQVQDELLEDSEVIKNKLVPQTDGKPTTQSSERGAVPKPTVELNQVAELSNFAETEQEQLTMQGFTLQLANVSQRKSLSSFYSQLSEEQDLIVSQYKNSYVLFLGQFATRAQAKDKAIELQKIHGFAIPWVRNWDDLTEYKILANEAN
ncbi:AAA family ATPase [Shewanella maritima]|uniref:AAA family ATPase n=1 Tax=Shewanella maritima TaxID=2520507 RepID=UPI0037361592